MCFVYPSHNHVLLLFFMSYHRICNKSSKISATSGARTAHPSGAHKFLCCSCCSIFRFLFDVFIIIVCLFYPFTFGHCCVCPSNYGFWLPLHWYHQPIVRLTYTYALGVYHNWSCKLDFHPWWCVYNAMEWDNIPHLPATGQWFYPDSYNNKINSGDISDILLKWC
jgi:hypothetical protein